MIKAKNKIYVGSSRRGYLSEEMISVIYDYVARQEVYEFTKAKPRKIGDRYLLEEYKFQYHMKLSIRRWF